MYTLVSGFVRYMLQKDEFNVLILGLDNAGKTTFLEQTQTKFHPGYHGMPLDKITATIGLNIGKIDHSGVRVHFWDLGGQQELQLLWDKYYSESHAIIYLVDSNDRNRMDQSKTAFETMLKNELVRDIPLLLVANKQDIQGCLSLDEVRALFAEYKHLIGHRDCKVMAASAIRGSGVQEGIDWVIAKLKQNSHNRPPIKK